MCPTRDGSADSDGVSHERGPRLTTPERLAARIREQIVSGELRPGDRLPTERELTSHYQTSRNSAREALQALAGQGLLIMKRGVSGGTFVAHPNPEQISGSLQTGLTLLTEGAKIAVSTLLEVREVLEVPAAEMAALRRTDDELAAIRETLFDPDRVDPQVVFASNRDFHFRVLEATHNPLLKVMTEPIFGVLKERFLRERAPARFWHDVDRDHREILGYMEVRDQAGAREATRNHLRNLRSTYENIDRELRDGHRLTSETSKV